MKACALSKEIADCSKRDKPNACKKRETLEKTRTGALRAGLMVKTRKIDRQELLEKWAA